MIQFEWDTNKNKQNIKKHKVSFEEAKTVFIDENARLIADPDHSLHEDRYVLLGLSSHFRLLVVCHVCERDDHLIRIISARKAKKQEIKIYQEYLP